MIIKFNKKIYRQSALKKAIKNFQRLADFSLKYQGDYFLIKIEKINPETKKTIKDEFLNHVLSLTAR